MVKHISKPLLFGAALLLLTGGLTVALAQEKKEATPVGIVKGTFFLGAFE